MALQTRALAPDLTERVLDKLGLSSYPEPTLADLTRIYAAWCRQIPFDNVQKIIHLHTGASGPLPGDAAADFFEAWLSDGTGGTCWAGNGGLHALLGSLGFAVTRGLGTMLSSPNVPPNHGTVVVDLDGALYLVDASILHSEPLRLDGREPMAIEHPAWGVQCRMQDDRWHIRWRPLHTPAGIDCRIEHLQATGETFRESHEGTRGWSPFNYEVAARLLTNDAIIGASFGERVVLDAGGESREPLATEDRNRFLVEKLGMSEEIISQLPPDTRTPPAPWARTAEDTWLGKRATG